MEPVFSIDKGFKAELCLWAQPVPNNLTQSWCTNSGMTRTQTTSYGKICVNHYTTVVAGGNILAQKKTEVGLKSYIRPWLYMQFHTKLLKLVSPVSRESLYKVSMTHAVNLFICFKFDLFKIDWTVV